MKTYICSLLIVIPYLARAEMVELEQFFIDKTEVSVGQFELYAKAESILTAAERDGGGLVYEFGWTQKPGWNWRSPYGISAKPSEPAVHLTYDEAAAFCRWSGKRLPTEPEWISAAYTEQRSGMERKNYTYPTGNSPMGANCLDGCGEVVTADVSEHLNRGRGHAEVGTTREGVNGLYDMGANVWEWVDIPDESSKGTRGGSWWYGPRQMRADYVATKPRDMAVVYIGFRCVKDK
jgi:formylglycine-generating enzyme required for sulfatase activity